MTAERQVGRINFQIKSRGTKSLSSASSLNVKAQSYKLVELSPDVLKEYRMCETNELVQLWKEKQEQLKSDGVSQKESENLKINKHRNGDLTK